MHLGFNVSQIQLISDDCISDSIYHRFNASQIHYILDSVYLGFNVSQIHYILDAVYLSDLTYLRFSISDSMHLGSA